MSPRCYHVFFFPFASLCQQSECRVLRGTLSFNPVVLTEQCNSKTVLSSLTCVRHSDTSSSYLLQMAARDVDQPGTKSKQIIRTALM